MNLIQIGFWVSVALAILKLLGFLTITWWWVAAPLLLALGIWLVLIVIGLVVVLIGAFFAWLASR